MLDNFSSMVWEYGTTLCYNYYIVSTASRRTHLLIDRFNIPEDDGKTSNSHRANHKKIIRVSVVLREKQDSRKQHGVGIT